VGIVAVVTKPLTQFEKWDRDRKKGRKDTVVAVLTGSITEKGIDKQGVKRRVEHRDAVAAMDRKTFRAWMRRNGIAQAKQRPAFVAAKRTFKGITTRYTASTLFPGDDAAA
jgi:hypothetical protein